MRQTFQRSLLIILLVTSPSALMGQEASFAGKWTLNVAKSHLTGQTVTAEKTASAVDAL